MNVKAFFIGVRITELLRLPVRSAIIQKGRGFILYQGNKNFSLWYGNEHLVIKSVDSFRSQGERFKAEKK